MNVVKYFTISRWASSGDSRLCEFPQPEGGSRAAGRRREPRPGSLRCQRLGILCKKLSSDSVVSASPIVCLFLRVSPGMRAEDVSVVCDYLR